MYLLSFNRLNIQGNKQFSMIQSECAMYKIPGDLVIILVLPATDGDLEKVYVFDYSIIAF